MNYSEVMDLILEYGKAKQDIGIEIGSTVFDGSALKEKCDQKQDILYKICLVILELNKKK